MRHTWLAFALLAAPALAQAPDDKAPPYTPPVTAPGGVGNQPVPVNTISEDRLAQIVDGAVNRALARMQQQAATQPTPSSQSAPATGPPQAYYQQPQPVVQYVQQPVTTVQFATQQPATTVQQSVQVLVPAGPLHRAMGRVGEHMAHKGEAKVRTLALAPATTTVTSVPVATTTMTTVPVAVPTPPAAYTPPLPAAYNPPPLPSKSAPAKGSPQR